MRVSPKGMSAPTRPPSWINGSTALFAPRGSCHLQLRTLGFSIGRGTRKQGRYLRRILRPVRRISFVEGRIERAASGSIDDAMEVTGNVVRRQLQDLRPVCPLTSPCTRVVARQDFNTRRPGALASYGGSDSDRDRAGRGAVRGCERDIKLFHTLPLLRQAPSTQLQAPTNERDSPAIQARRSIMAPQRTRNTPPGEEHQRRALWE